jgi:SAM-dependent methyltransferase
LIDDATKTIREDYDRLAEQYALHVADELQHKPLDRELLDRFAARVRGHGEVCDMGCGPGHVTRYLYDAGLPIFGLDLSARMLEQARRRNPEVAFRAGNMLQLDLPDAVLAGIVAFYAIVNLSPDVLFAVFQEMFRVLRPGGLLLLSFHVGDKLLEEDELWGVKIAMRFRLFRSADIRQILERTGFLIEQIIERQPYPNAEYPSTRAYVFASRTSLNT